MGSRLYSMTAKAGPTVHWGEAEERRLMRERKAEEKADDIP